MFGIAIANSIESMKLMMADNDTAAPVDKKKHKVSLKMNVRAFRRAEEIGGGLGAVKRPADQR